MYIFRASKASTLLFPLQTKFSTILTNEVGLTDAFKTVRIITIQALKSRLHERSWNDILRLEIVAGCNYSLTQKGVRDMFINLSLTHLPNPMIASTNFKIKKDNHIRGLPSTRMN